LSCVLALLLIAAACTTSDDKKDGRKRKKKDRVEATPTIKLPTDTDFASPVAIETAAEPKGDWFESACDLPPDQLKVIARGYDAERSPEITVVPKAPNFFGSFVANSHSGPWDYVQRIPIVFYGPGFIQSQGDVTPDRQVTVADIAPTIAELVGTEWPSDRPSASLSEALLPAAERPSPPKLVVMVVWDGAGRNVLEQWSKAWPNLASMMEKGTSFANAIVGSSPSVTPSSHANMGTGTFPNEHGIIDIPVRLDGKIVGSWDGKSPRNLNVESLADLYDLSRDNEPLIGMMGDHGWHLGMIGHGSYLEGADQDIAVLFGSDGGPKEASEYYAYPSYLGDVEGREDDVKTIDREDGKADSKWMGNDVLSRGQLEHESPAGTLYQTRLIRAMLTREGFGQDKVPDLFFTNYKQIDYTGHRFNMLQKEMQRAVHYSDQELGELEGFLNELVGEEQWVVVVTADHGSTPSALATKAWPIGTKEIVADISEHFDAPEKKLIDMTRVTGFWINEEGLESAGATTEDLAEFLLDMRIEDNAVAVDQLPKGYQGRLDEHIFSAAFPSSEMGEILQCAKVEL
jgi:Type I phosphodiesterase / nucleotide pyrophosphatase